MPESESVVLSIKRYEQTVKVVKYCRDTILFPPASSLTPEFMDSGGGRQHRARSSRSGRPGGRTSVSVMLLVLLHLGDVIVGNSGDGNLLLPPNHSQPIALPGGRPDTRAIVVGDVVGDDGLVDMVVGGWPNVSLMLLRNHGSRHLTAAALPGMPLPAGGTGNGTFAVWTEALALADVDGDGDLDLIIANNEEPNYLMLNSPSGFSRGVALPGGSGLVTGSLAVGDIDGCSPSQP